MGSLHLLVAGSGFLLILVILGIYRSVDNRAAARCQAAELAGQISPDPCSADPAGYFVAAAAIIVFVAIAFAAIWTRRRFG